MELKKREFGAEFAKGSIKRGRKREKKQRNDSESLRCSIFNCVFHTVLNKCLDLMRLQSFYERLARSAAGSSRNYSHLKHLTATPVQRMVTATITATGSQR